MAAAVIPMMVLAIDIFDDITNNDLRAVQERVKADATVMETQTRKNGETLLMFAIFWKRVAIALWLILNRGQHNVDTKDRLFGATALHHASSRGQLQVVKALVAAEANPVVFTIDDETPLMRACIWGHTDIVAFLVRLPAVKASINLESADEDTALSCACWEGYPPIVRLLLDAGADPTIPAGYPPRRQVIDNATIDEGPRHDICTLLLQAINEAKRARECVAWLGKGKKEIPEELLVKVRGCLVHAWANEGKAGVL